MSHTEVAEQPLEVIAGRIRDEILPLFSRAIADDQVYFENPHVPPCWERKNCTTTACSAHGHTGTRCWQVAGTFCGGVVQGEFAEKYTNCSECNVFRESCPTLVEELGEHLNNLLFLLRKEKATTQKQMKKIECLNKELLSSLENLDSRNREIQQLVITDRLTNLYNRHYLQTALDDEIHRSSRSGNVFSLMMIDLDDFKTINDTYGHACGDEMLSCLGSMFRENIRQGDRVFRYGGEEFVIILPETNLTIAWIAAERLRKLFAEKQFVFKCQDGTTQTASRTLSIGLAHYEPGLDTQTLILHADEAMYKAKMDGKNKVVRHDVD